MAWYLAVIEVALADAQDAYDTADAADGYAAAIAPYHAARDASDGAW